MKTFNSEKQVGENVYIQIGDSKMTKISCEDDDFSWEEIVEANKPKHDYGNVWKSLKGEYHLTCKLTRESKCFFRKLHNDAMREAKKAEDAIIKNMQLRSPYIDWKTSFFIKDGVIRSLKGQTIKEQLRVINSFNNLCPGNMIR